MPAGPVYDFVRSCRTYQRLLMHPITGKVAWFPWRETFAAPGAVAYRGPLKMGSPQYWDPALRGTELGSYRGPFKWANGRAYVHTPARPAPPILPDDVQTECCVHRVKKNLTVFAVNEGGCSCVSGVTGTMKYESAAQTWRGVLHFPACSARRKLYLRFYCLPGSVDCSGWRLDLHDGIEQLAMTFDATCVCFPFAVSFLYHDTTGSFCNTSGFVRFTIADV